MSYKWLSGVNGSSEENGGRKCATTSRSPLRLTTPETPSFAAVIERNALNKKKS
jgi:hypothetical protein